MKKSFASILLSLGCFCIVADSSFDMFKIRKIVEKTCGGIPGNTVLFIQAEEFKGRMPEKYCNDGRMLDLVVRMISQELGQRVHAQAILWASLSLYVPYSCDITEYVIDIINSYEDEGTAKSPNERLYGAVVCSHDIEAMKQAIADRADVNLEKAGKPLIFWVLLSFKEHSGNYDQKNKLLEILIENDMKVDESMLQLVIRKKCIGAAIKIAERCHLDLSSPLYENPKPIYDHKTGQHMYQKSSLLDCARAQNDLDSIFYLLRKCVPATGYTNSLMSIALGHLNLVQELINRGYIVNDIWSNSSLYSYPKTVQLFINNGADPNYQFETQQCKEKWTPLLWAVYHKQYETIKVLLDAKANINQTVLIPEDCHWIKPGTYTPLKLAIVVDAEIDIIDLLLKSGATE